MWFSFVENGEYKGDEPDFFDISTSKWHPTLSNGFDQIKSEFITTETEAFIPYYNKTFANRPENWKVIPLLFWGNWKQKNLEQFPETSNVLTSIPHIVSAAFSKLTPHTEIKPHTGDSNVMYRIHLPIIVPKESKELGLKVRDSQILWEEGVPVAFCDAHKHLAWNLTDEDRIVLILDVIRPEYEKKTKLICSIMIASLFYQFLLQKTNLLHHTPKLIRRLMLVPPICLIYPYMMIRNLFKPNGK